MRRLIEYCPELTGRITKNSTGDEVHSLDVCKKELKIAFESPQFDCEGDSTGQLYQILKCGHVRLVDEDIWLTRPANTRNSLWNKLLPKQQEACEFVESSGFNAYLDMQMGTGKTPVSLTILRENLDLLTPCLIICEAGDIYRWKREARKWLGGVNPLKHKNEDGTQKELTEEELSEMLSLVPQILDKKGARSASVGRVTITSWTNIKDPSFTKLLQDKGYKCIISDEAHMFKNPKSARSQAFIKLCSFIPHRIFLSGTWIENNIEEAFIPLNILDPKYFNSPASLEQHCVISSRGKLLSLHPRWRDTFFSRISKYIYRLTKEELGAPLPPLTSYSKGNREPIWLDPYKYRGNNEHIEAYNAICEQIEYELANKASSSTLIGLMSSMRHHVGKMKVRGAVEFITLKMMEMGPGEKLLVGVHHKAVMSWLKQALETVLGQTILTMSDEDALIKDKIEDQWKSNPQNQILIISILGAGKGRNFQFCRHVINLERQWNKAREIQFEERCHRIKTDPITDEILRNFTEEDTVIIDYLMAKDTFDEYFDHLVRLKGIIMDSVDSEIDDEEIPEPNFVRELAEMVVAKRMHYIDRGSSFMLGE